LYKTDDVEHEEDKAYAKNIHKALMPYARFMYVLCRFPLHARKDERTAYEYYFSFKSPVAIGFCITGVILA